MTQRLFFAAKSDLDPVIQSVEVSARLQYVRMGSFPGAEIQAFLGAARIPNLGAADANTASACDSYLVCNSDATIQVRRIAMAGGETRYLVDQLVNPDTITFTPAGAWSDEILLHGRIATASNSEEAAKLMNLFDSAVKKHFTKVKAFYVGHNALAWLDAGRRLTISDQSPREFDLTR